MKNILTLSLLIIVALSSCKKKGCTDPTALNYSTEANKDDGSCILPSDILAEVPEVQPSQIIFEEQFNLTFGSTVSYGIYNPTFDYAPGDAIILEHLTDPTYNYWSPLPFVTTGIVVWGEYGYDIGDVWIYIDEVDTGNDFIWTSDVTFGFRALLIKKTALILNPNLENMTINEVKAILE